MDFLLTNILQYDRALFVQINQVWVHPWLDVVMPIITDLHKNPVVKMAIIPVLLAYWIYRQRMRAVKTIVLGVMALALSDSISYRIIKPLVSRNRPADSGMTVVLQTDNHSGLSFPSNHAANIFTIGNFVGLAVPPLRPTLLLFAAAVAYSRVYVGVHFPIDVLAGAIIGMIISTVVWYIGQEWVEHETKKMKKLNNRR